MKVALVHYWLVNMRGGEKVLECLCELFPQADIYTHVYNPEAVSRTIGSHKVFTTFIQKLPQSVRRYQSYLPLMPIALEQLDLREYSLIISSESGPAKGIVASPGSCHICYCHTPMRYVWDMYHDYYSGAGALRRFFMPPVMHYLRLWDYASAARVDHFIANSRHVAKRILKHYGREAEVIPPPVDTRSFEPTDEKGDFFLMVGQLVRYKRADLAVEAFNRMGGKLVIIGDGEMLPEIRSRAGPNVKALGYQPFEIVRDHYSRCRALIFPGEEDFGIVPVEVMASGRPVIAYRKGGVTESVQEGVTGLFFDEQTVQSLIDAVDRFESIEPQLSSRVIVDRARQFDREVFLKRMSDTIDRCLKSR